MAARRPQHRLTAAQRAAERERAEWLVKMGRDVALFVAGLGLTVFEGVTHGPERPSLYVLYAGMMGLGPVLRYAESRAKERQP